MLPGSIHFVVFVKRGDVPGDVGRDSGHKIGQALQFVFGVVEAGNEQGHDLQPKPIS